MISLQANFSFDNLLSIELDRSTELVIRLKKRGWDIFNGVNNLKTRDKLLALKLIMECNEAKFALFKEGPTIMQVKSMEERLAKIESREVNH
jgi:hypothetical protein